MLMGVAPQSHAQKNWPIRALVRIAPGPRYQPTEFERETGALEAKCRSGHLYFLTESQAHELSAPLPRASRVGGNAPRWARPVVLEPIPPRTSATASSATLELAP